MSFAGLVEGLARSLVQQRLGDGWVTPAPLSWWVRAIQFLAREPVEVILHGDALAQGFVHL
jgi:hypothetical protein